MHSYASVAIQKIFHARRKAHNDETKLRDLVSLVQEMFRVTAMPFVRNPQKQAISILHFLHFIPMV